MCRQFVVHLEGHSFGARACRRMASARITSNGKVGEFDDCMGNNKAQLLRLGPNQRIFAASTSLKWLSLHLGEPRLGLWMPDSVCRILYASLRACLVPRPLFFLFQEFSRVLPGRFNAALPDR